MKGYVGFVGLISPCFSFLICSFSKKKQRKVSNLVWPSLLKSNRNFFKSVFFFFFWVFSLLVPMASETKKLIKATVELVNTYTSSFYIISLSIPTPLAYPPSLLDHISLTYVQEFAFLILSNFYIYLWKSSACAAITLNHAH